MTNHLRVALLLSFTYSLAFAVSARAQTTVTLQDGTGYTGTTDAWISCCDASNMTFGLNNDMELRGEASDSAVIRFAIFQSEGGVVPAGATINSAVLSLYKYDGPDAVFSASRLLRSWNEAQVTWNSPWTIAGAGAGSDYVAGSTEQGSVAAASGCTTSPFPSSCWLSIDVTGSVQQFANGSAQNFGWKIAQVSSSAEGSYKNFVSKDNAGFDTLRPKLTVTYSTAPASPCNSGTLRPFDQAPINGNPISIPAGGATFEGEHFNCGGQNNAYHDNVAGNIWGLYRTTEDVDITTSTGASGYVVNNFETGEWLTYTISMQTFGVYDIGILASNNLQPSTTAIFHVEIDNTNVGTISVPNTGGWDMFNWFTKGGVPLNAGQHVLKLYADQQYGNVDELHVLPSSSGECSAPDLQLCIQFEPAPDTTFSGGTVTSQSRGASIVWFAQNAAPDLATDTSRVALISGGRDGSTAIKLQTLDNDNNVHSSFPWERSEIEMSPADSAALVGTESWWADSLYIPIDSVLPSATDTQVNLFQFHGNVGSAPNFALSIINQTGTNQHKVFRAYTAGGDPNGPDPTQYNYVIDGTTHRIGQCIFDDVQLGVWYDFVHHIRWSSSSTGSHEIWMRKAGGAVKKVLDRQGISTAYTADSPFLKLGVYHDPVPGNTSVVHDRLRRGSSADAVRLPDFPVDPAQPVTWCLGTSP
jgi:hypothetical protein